MKNKNIVTLVVFLILFISTAVITAKYYFLLKETKGLSASVAVLSQEKNSQPLSADLKNGSASDDTKSVADGDEKKEVEKKEGKNGAEPLIKISAYNGQIFSAKIPEGWKVSESIGGINIVSPDDSNIGAFLVALPQAPGSSSPDEFLKTIIKWDGLSEVKYVSESDEKTTTIPQSPPFPDFVWKEKSIIFTAKKDDVPLKIKSVNGVVNIYNSYSAIAQGFQSPLDAWGKWAPMLERISSSIIITNPQKVGAKDTVRLPSAKDLANDSSPIMDVWNYRNRVEDRASHEFSEAMMGVETDLVSPSTGRTYSLPMENYDPTEGGYHNPDNYQEILRDSYK